MPGSRTRKASFGTAKDAQDKSRTSSVRPLPAEICNPRWPAALQSMSADQPASDISAATAPPSTSRTPLSAQPRTCLPRYNLRRALSSTRRTARIRNAVLPYTSKFVTSICPAHKSGSGAGLWGLWCPSTISARHRYRRSSPLTRTWQDSRSLFSAWAASIASCVQPAPRKTVSHSVSC